MAIENISKVIQKYTTKQPSIGSIGADTTTTTIFNHDALLNYVKDGYLDKGAPHILMTGAAMKPFNTGIPEPSDPTTMGELWKGQD